MTGASKMADVFEVQQIIHQYAMALDVGEYERLRDIFTPDATLNLNLPSIGLCQGHDSIISTFKASEAPGGWMHHVTTCDVSISGDSTATARTAMIAQVFGHGEMAGQVLQMFGRWDDELQRTDKGWRITKRELQTMGTVGDMRVIGRATGSDLKTA